MSKIKYTLSIMTVVAGMATAVPFIVGFEDEKLKSYQDAVGIWTICGGETFGVSKNDALTKEQCRMLTQSRIGQFMMTIAEMIEVPITANTLAAHTSFAYNIGLSAYKDSQTFKLTNAGKIKAGCEAIATCTYSKEKKRNVGYGCGLAKGKPLNGLIRRRQEEKNLCLSGL